MTIRHGGIAPHRRPRRRLALVAAPAVALLSAAAAARAADTADAADKVRIASGRPGGMYWALASSLGELLAPRHAVGVVATEGSTENLRRLEAGDVRFALAQQDVVSEHFRNRPDGRTRVVGRVFFDYLHIFIRRPIRLETASDLSRLRIWAGEPGSGTRLTASRFFDSLGTPFDLLPARVRPRAAAGAGLVERPLALADVAEEFRHDRLDAAMIVTTPGLPAICALMSSETAVLYPLDPRTLRRLTEEEAGAFQRQTALGRIPAGTYENQSAPVATLSVPVLLLARAGEEREVARAVHRAAQEAWDRREPWERLMRQARWQSGGEPPRCRFPQSLPRAAALSASQLPPLGGPLEEPLWPRFRGAFRRLFPLAAAVALGLLAYRRRWHEPVRVLWQQDKLPFVVASLLGLAIALVTVTTFLLERGINENFSSFGESFWSITVYLFSGLEDRTPYTDTGRVVATLGLLLGPAFFAVMSGWLARFFIRRDRRMPHNLRDHILLLNWTPRAADLVREIHHPIIREREGTFVVVVLTNDESLEIRRFKEAGSGRDAAFEDFYVSIGDPTDERALRNANSTDARSVLILADESGGDERAVRSVLMLRKIAREVGRSDLHVVVELTNPANGSVLDELADGFPGLLERISGLEIRTFLLSQAALSAGIVDFYRDLLQISQETNEMYTLEVPDGALGMPFRDYAALILRAEVAEPLIPIGLQRTIDGRPRILTNPRPGQPGWTIERGDRLLVIAYQPPLASALPVPAAPERLAS
jgi:TRAP transporter TAXI family solute receptor